MWLGTQSPMSSVDVASFLRQISYYPEPERGSDYNFGEFKFELGTDTYVY